MNTPATEKKVWNALRDLVSGIVGDKVSKLKDDLIFYDQAARVGHKPVYRNIGEQLQDISEMARDRRGAPEARERYQKVVNASGANTGIDSDGGYLVETDKTREVRQTAIEAGVLASRCEPQPIGANADSYSYLAFGDRDRSTGTMAGGLQVFRKGEADLMQSSGKAKFEERELRVEDMYGLLYVTNRMMRDAAALTAYVKRALKKQLGWKLDYEIWQGSGVVECLGITKSDLLIVVPKEIDQTARSINGINVVEMLARFTGNIRKAAWFVNQDCLPQLPNIMVSGSSLYSSGDFLAPFGRLCGIPVEPLEFCSTVGNLYDIVLGDFSQYLLIEKGVPEETMSAHVKFLNDETVFRFVTRNNGQPEQEEPITPLNGTNTLSPFVALEARE